MNEKEKAPTPPMHGGRHARGLPVQKPKDIRKTLKKLWKYLSVYKIKLFLVFLFVTLTTIANLVSTRLIGVAIDSYIIKADVQGLLRIVFVLLALYVCCSLFTWLQMTLCVNIAQFTVSEIRRDLFDRLQSLPLKYFDTHTHGEIMSRITNDVDNIANSLNVSLSQAVQSFLSIIGTFVFMLLISPVLTLINLVTIPLLTILTSFVTKHSRKYFKEQQKVLGQLNGKIEEVISGQKVVKVFVKEQGEIEEFSRYNKNLNEIGIKAQIFSGVIGPISTLINNIGYGLVAVVGGVLSLFGIIEFGSITSFLIYSKHFGRPFNELASQYNMLLSAIAGAERVFEVIEQKPEPPDEADAVELKDVTGRVSFENVYFEYENENPILKNINLDVKPGQTIALVGPTGAGKTTIINLLTRFYDIQKGSIAIDNTDITHIKRDSLRSTLGIVLQDTYLFSGTIMENIRYGRLNASDSEVKNAAVLSNAHEFIRRLPNGYDTVLSEDDDSLSQGQKQMLAIARAILADPAILILDEATSNVDTRTEVKIQQAMLNLMKGRTSFVIAHRLSTIRNADMIVVINDGTVIEKGTHSELLSKKGFYYNLYMNQFAA